MSESPLPPFGLATDLGAFVDHSAPPAQGPAPAPPPVVHLVLFRLGEDRFCLEVARVREVVRVTHLSRIPQAPPHVRGVQSLRGVILPVLELRTRIGLEAATVTAESRILVVEGRERMLGLLVDGVTRVARIEAREIRPPPAEVRSQLSAYVTGVTTIEERLALQLDLDALLSLPAPHPSPEAS